MAARDYLKVAAAHLQRAAGQLNQQMRDLTHERDRRTRRRSDEIARHQVDLKVKQAQLVQSPQQDNDPRMKVRLVQEVRELQQKVASKQQEIQQVTNDLTQVAQAKQQRADEFIGKAKELESEASAPELMD